MMEDRIHSFQRLKPACVALSQTVLSFSASRSTGQEVTARLEDLTEVIKTLDTRSGHLDPKLADYVFFPISQVLKTSRALPVRAMEFCLEALAVLISRGWSENIDPSLSSQLVIFLSLTCDTSGKTIAVSQVTDELLSSAYNCMTKLFVCLRSNVAGKSSLIAGPNIPTLGHAVSVILDGISGTDSFGVQNNAAEALGALLYCIEDAEVLSSFFPGIVSLLAKVITPSTKTRHNWKIIVQCLEILCRLMRSLLDDRVVANYPEVNSQADAASAQGRVLTASWVKATSSQFKVVLANIERLCSHSRLEVRQSLAELNAAILEYCSTSLQNCCAMALRTSMLLLEQGHESSCMATARLRSLVQSKAAVAETLAAVFHDELLSLTRVMQSNDDHIKEKVLRIIFGAYNMLAETSSDPRTSSRMLTQGLRDGVTAILRSADPKTKINPQQNVSMLVELPSLDDMSALQLSTSSLALHKSQRELLSSIQMHLEAVKAARLPLGIAAELAMSLPTSGGDLQVASLWLILQELRGEDTNDDVLGAFTTIGENSSTSVIREQLYSLAVDILADMETDWRLQTLALETVTMQAKQQGEDFRNELADTLYPVLQHIGSDTAQVRAHAMACLTAISAACRYTDVKELIVANIDYLVNAVALKLNSFDVSPQGPQVLLTMVRLAGPSLLPYLEDTLESIFAALEDYHGYPALVALLFAVLSTIAEEGAKSPKLQIEYKPLDADSRALAWTPLSMPDLIKAIQQMASKSAASKHATLPDKMPHRPWKELDSNFEQVKGEIDQQDAGAEDEEDSAPAEREPPPAPRTYALLLKITTLTQHYLSSSSPSLRLSLLTLIRTTIPALAKHEDSYLPLINTLWPEITSRLLDDELSVVKASLQIISTLCQYAGDFMRGRIAALWPQLVTLHGQLSRELTGRDQTNGTVSLRSAGQDYVDVSHKTAWQSLVELMKTIVKHVGLDAEFFEELLVMLQPLDELEPEVKVTLDEYNADAVWLAQHRCGRGSSRSEIQSSGSWHFIEIAR